MNSQTKETFLTFDIENNSQGLMKSIGIVMIKEGEIADHFYSDINLNVSIEESILNLKNLWVSIEKYFVEADFYVCFKVANHKSSLIQSLELAGISLPDKPFVCVNTLAVLRLPGIKSDRESLTSHFDIFFDGSNEKDLNEAFLSFYVLLKLLALNEPNTLQDLVQYYKDSKEKNAKKHFMRNLPDANFEGVVFEDIEAASFDGKRFLMTGNFEKFPKREVAEKLLIEMGGIITSGVSKNLDYLIVATGAGPAKIDKAKQIQTDAGKLKIVSENGLYHFLDL